MQGKSGVKCVTVTRILVNSPAAASCRVFPGDELVTIDNVSTNDMTAAHAASLLAGKSGLCRYIHTIHVCVRVLCI